MTNRAHLIVRFLVIFLLVLAPLAAVWGWLAPPYGAAVAHAARPALRLVERDDVSVIAAQRDEVWVLRRIGGDRVTPFMEFDRYAFFSLIPLVALLAATPGMTWRRRLGRIALGCVALFAVHVAYVVASVELSYAALGLAPSGAWLGPAQIVVRLLWEASPIAVWLLLSARAWTSSWRAPKDELERRRRRIAAFEV